MKRHLRSQKGQSSIEAIALMIGFVVIATLVSGYFRDNNLLSRATEGPWSYLAGMIEGGVWLPAERVKPYHPSQFSRVRTIEPRGTP